MNRTPMNIDLNAFPPEFRSLLNAARVYNSSCSDEAQVYFLDYKDGFFLKSAPAGSLQKEARMTAYFHSRHLSAEVLTYLPGERDWLLTRRIPGEDCTHPQYLEDPLRLCDTVALHLRQLHELDSSLCPVPDRNESYIQTACQHHNAGIWDRDLFPEIWTFGSAEEAWQTVQETFPCLKNDVLLHGDYCLPNILLRDWNFSGFIDVGQGGIGDRHIDLFWGAWTLNFNLKTNRYFQRFLDAYGKEQVNQELLRGIAAIETFG